MKEAHFLIQRHLLERHETAATFSGDRDTVRHYCVNMFSLASASTGVSHLETPNSEILAHCHSQGSHHSASAIQARGRALTSCCSHSYSYDAPSSCTRGRNPLIARVGQVVGLREGPAHCCTTATAPL